MNWNEAIKELDNRRQKALMGGGQNKIDKQHAIGKMTARERIEVLLDPGTFVEVDGFLESRIDDFDLDKRRVPGDGVVTGYGEIDGQRRFYRYRRYAGRISFFQNLSYSGYGDGDEGASNLHQ